MICWITERIGTGAFEKVSLLKGKFEILDVRQLVDKQGNPAEEIKKYIQAALGILSKGKKIVICCDHGISRSNSIACGVLAKWSKISFFDAVRMVITKTGHAEMKPALLDIVWQTLNLKLKGSVSSNAVLLTGATGDIGSRLLTRISSSFNVIGISSREINLISDLPLFYSLVKEKNIKTVIHLAHPRISNTNAAMGEAVTMMKTVVDVCLANKCKLIFVSSLEVYGGSRRVNLKAGTKTKLIPRGIFGQSKYLCEELLRLSADPKQYCTIRLPAVYGKGCKKPKFIYDFINKGREEKDIVTHKYANGFPVVDMLHVDDAVKCIHAVLKKSVHGAFPVSGGNPISTKAIATIITQKMNSASRIYSMPVHDKNCNIVADNSMIFKKSRWKPSRRFSEAIEELI